MNYTRLRILASGFSEAEYDLYGLGQLSQADSALQFLSQKHFFREFRPKLNGGTQKYCLEDKWITYCYLRGLGIPTPETLGLFHPDFGKSNSGEPMTCAEEIASVLDPGVTHRLFFKPRGGRQARNVYVVDISLDSKEGGIVAVHKGREQLLEEFLQELPSDAYDDYDGSYHGWLVQSYIQQHAFLSTLNPHSVNTVRVVTYLDTTNKPQILACVLKLGRKGTDVDAWSKGGVSVAVDPNTGELGYGRQRPEFGIEKLSLHPDTEEEFRGKSLPYWEDIESLVKRTALMYTGVRAVGWDVALSVDGPQIVEGNVDWSLPMMQIHSQNGLLTPRFRADLAVSGVCFPERLPGFLATWRILFVKRWRETRGPLLIARFREKVARIFSI